jgi:hypothetical protein
MPTTSPPSPGRASRRSAASTTVRDQFVNLLPQTVRGLDFAFYWQSPKTDVGKFDFSVNATRLLKFSRAPGDAVDLLVAARAAGDINAATPLPETQNLIEANGRPKWRGTASLTWSLGEFQIGAFARYTGAVDETAFVDADGDPWRVKSQVTGNLYAQVRIKDRCRHWRRHALAGRGAQHHQRKAAAFVRRLSGVALQPLWPLLVHLGHHGVLI